MIRQVSKEEDKDTFTNVDSAKKIYQIWLKELENKM